MTLPCSICGNVAGNSTYTVAEMMYGSGNSFEYFECAQCKCLQIAAVPDEMSKYYPPTYYSFCPAVRHRNFIKRIGLRALCRYAVARSPLQPLLRVLIARRYSNLYLIGVCRLQSNSRILDVGSGSGGLVTVLREGGFRNVFGLDPYLSQDVRAPDGQILVFSHALEEHHGNYDLIMFHHSFEHVSDPLQTLLSVQHHLRPKGQCLIRMPTVSSWAWRHYRENWCQLDPPRHTYLHSIDSIRILSARAHLRLERVIYDSTEFQFWGSERYTRGAPLCRPGDSSALPTECVPSQLRRYRKQARRLNAMHDGDQAAFYLVPDLHETR